MSGSATTPPPTKSRKRRGCGCCGCVSLSLVIVILAGAGFVLTELDIDPAHWAREAWEIAGAFLQRRAPPPDPWALPPMPPQEVTHPDGVRFAVPEGALAEQARVTIAALSEAPPTEPFERTEPAYEFDALSLAPPLQAATVDLPAGKAGDRAVVLYYSVGSWVRIPSEPVQLADGSPGRRIRVDGIPFPWQFAVAAAPPDNTASDTLASGNSREAMLARLEQLRVTDREAYRAEVKRVAARFHTTNRRAPLSLLPSAHAAPRLLHADRPRAQLQEAQLAFFLADDPDGGADYAKGLRHLWNARQAIVVQGVDTESSMDDRRDHEEWGGSMAVYGGRLPLVDMIEYYMGTFAPWGLELMLGLLEAENGWYQQHFDVRVLPRYGTLPLLNMPMPGGEQPVPILDTSSGYPHQYIQVLDQAQRELARILELIESEALVTTTLTLYSPRLFRMTDDEMLHLFKQANSGIGALMGMALLLKTAPVTGIAASAWVAYKITAPIVEHFVVGPKITELDQRGAMEKKNALTLYKSGKMIGNLLLDPKKGVFGKVWNEATDIALMHMIDYAEITSTERLRSLGSPYGYRDSSARRFPTRPHPLFGIPPILVRSTVYGPTNHRPHPAGRRKPTPAGSGSYETRATGQVEHYLSYNRLAGDRRDYKLSESYRENRPSELAIRPDVHMRTEFPYGAHLIPVMRGDDRWINITQMDLAPDLQAIRWSIPDSQLRRWAEALDLASIEELLEEIEVYVYAVTTPEEVDPYRRCPFVGDDDRSNKLRDHLLRDGARRQRRFALLIKDHAHPFVNHIYNAREEKMGRWHRIPCYTVYTGYRCMVLNYTVRLMYGDSELMSFPATFGERGPDNEIEHIGKAYDVSRDWLRRRVKTERTQYILEIADVRPPRDDRPDIMAFLLPEAGIPQGYFEHARSNISEYGGVVPVDAAEQIIRTTSFLLKAPPPPRELLSPVLPSMASEQPEDMHERFPDDEWEKDERGTPLRRKGTTELAPRVEVALRVVRPGPTGIVGDAMLRGFKKKIAHGTQLEEDGPNRWVSTRTAANATLVIRKDDLVIALVGTDNREATEDVIRELAPHVQAHIVETLSQHAISP